MYLNVIFPLLEQLLRKLDVVVYWFALSVGQHPYFVTRLYDLFSEFCEFALSDDCLPMVSVW